MLLGPLQALGLQAKAAITTVLSLYLIGVPLEIGLGFKADKGIFGLYIGFSTSQVITFTAFLLMVLTRDWQKVADEAVERIAKSDAEIIERSVDVNTDDDFKAVRSQ